MRAQHCRPTRKHAVVEQASAPVAAESLLPVLQQVQSRVGYLDAGTLGAASDKLRVPDARTYGVASFYSMLATQPRTNNVIRVCDGPVCELFGCQMVRDSINALLPAGQYVVERTSCLGLCDRAPALLVNLEPCGPVSCDRAGAVLDGWRGSVPSYAQPRAGEIRVTLARLGHIDPDDIDTVLRAGGYDALRKALVSTPSDVLRTVTDSGLQGRGGAGFPTGRKWQMVADAVGPVSNRPIATRSSGKLETCPTKYVICNADESEPATFKDRILMEEDPHLLLEGMALAGYAVGAEVGYIYIRGEYENAMRRIVKAVAQAQLRSLLGKNIQGSGFSFDVHVHRGAGAYICGEETALLESLEGRRGEPRVRPPYPTTSGLWGQPTVVNNVETLCLIPAIVRNGSRWYRAMGTATSPGTKLFTVTGHVKQPGLFEAPLGTTLRQVIDDFCGGMRDGAELKMALTGGAAGTIVGKDALDVRLDFAAAKHGVSLGAGGIMVCDQSVSVSRLLGWLLRFFQVESCGKCTPCREGTGQLREIVERMAEGDAKPGDIEKLRQLSRMLRLTSFCGLGQSVAWPLDSALANFAEEFSHS